MIINIAGTSGSGKSTIVRSLMAMCTSEPVTVEGRKTPIGYDLALPGGSRVRVLGAYEAPTGGCDTIKDAVLNYRLVTEWHRTGLHVVYEGLFVMNHTRGLALARDVGVENVTVILLATTLDQCKAGVNARRAVEGKPPLQKWDNTEGNHTRARNYATKMQRTGVRVLTLERDLVLPRILELLS